MKFHVLAAREPSLTIGRATSYLNPHFRTGADFVVRSGRIWHAYQRVVVELDGRAWNAQQGCRRARAVAAESRYVTLRMAEVAVPRKT
jgi:hypothetical protein